MISARAIYYNYPKKELATNEKLVKRIMNIVNELGREFATPAEARKIIGLRPL